MSERDPEDGADIPDDWDEDADRDTDDAPLEDLAREVRDRRENRERAEDDDAVDDLFESVDVGEVDTDAVWEQLEEGQTAEASVGMGVEVEATEPTAEAGGEEHVVPKREFCQQCPHFTDPPETACTHEGTDIVEVVDSDSFRVRNCPVVDEQREDAFARMEDEME
jgi:hypothetical protein